MDSQVGTKTICSAQTLTNAYALQEDELQTVDGTNKWFQLYAETQTTLDITYTTGAAETDNYVEFYIEFGSGAVTGTVSTVTWARETMEYFDDSANQIVLEEWTYKIDGAAAATAYTKRIQLPVCTKGIRIYAKEVGVAANYGTLTIKANTQAAGAVNYNRSLQTVTLEASGITIGDVRITDGTDISDVNADFAETLASTTNSLAVMGVSMGWDSDAATPIARALQVAVDNATISATPNVLVVGGIYKNADDTYNDNDAVPFHFTASGELRTAGGSSVSSEYRATTNGCDGTAVYASGTTLTVTGTPFTINDEDLVYIREVDATGNTANLWVNGQSGVHMEIAAGTLTRSGGSDFSANGVYEVGYNGQKKSYNAATDSNQEIEMSPLDEHYEEAGIDVDTTNVGAGPTYYPSSTGLEMGNMKDFSFTGKLVEGDAEDNTLTVEVMNDEDTTSGDWQQVYFYDAINDVFVNSYGCNAATTNMAGFLDELNVNRVRFKFVGGGSATNTIIIKARAKAL